MSIIENFRKSRAGYVSAQAPQEGSAKREVQKILDLSYLKDMLTKVMDNMLTEEKDVDNNRKHNYVWSIDIANVLGYVDTPQWVFMIESMVEWLVENWTSVQPNGKWELYKYEQRVETKELKRRRAVGQNQDGTPQIHESIEPRQVLIIGAQLVDVQGQRDLVYEMGRPKTQTQNGFDPEVLKEMLKGAPSQNQKDPEMEMKMQEQEQLLNKQSAELEQMREQMRQNSEIMAGLLAELQSGRLNAETETGTPVKKSPAKTTRRRKK